MSTPTEQKEFSTEKEEASTDQEEVSMEKGEASTDQKQVSTEKREASTDQKYNNWIPAVIKIVEWVYNYCDQHYPPTIEEKISDMEERISSCIEDLDEIPEEKRQSQYERSMFEYLKGKLYNAVPGVYKEEAELHLGRAIGLNPSLLDAWKSLGVCLAKKGDYHRAKRYFEFVLQQVESSTFLRQLAELELVFARGSEDPPYHIDQCIEYSQSALALDDNDGRCFYALGNAYLTSFLLDGGWNHDKLPLSLEAYEKAEQTAAMKSNPNVQYECGIGKSKGKNKGKSKKKSTETSLSSLIQSLDTIDLNPSYNRATMDILTEGLNKGMVVICAVRCLVKYDYNAPVYYVLCDSDENSFVLTVFGIQKEAHYQFKSVRVNLLEQVLVNGNVVSPKFALRGSIVSARKRA